MTNSKLLAVPPTPNKGEKKEVKATDLPATLPKTDPKEQPDRPPLEDRIFRVQQLADLIEVREKLTNSLKKLKSLNTTSDRREVKITIEDANNEWETWNTDAIKACVEAMSSSIQQKLQDVEAQIHF